MVADNKLNNVVAKLSNTSNQPDNISNKLCKTAAKLVNTIFSSLYYFVNL
jgi:hypothetical protein